MIKSEKNIKNKRQLMTLTISEVHKICCEMLLIKGASYEVATLVVDELIINEVNGYTSHGLMRLIEYANLLQQGHIISSNRPIVHQKNKFVAEVDGQKCFGVLSTEVVSKTLINHISTNQFGVTMLTNSGHIGRLRSLAAPVCRQGGVVIGFSNLSGAGQNVMPYGGNEGRLCTNPIVIGVPSDPPIILDMSTSTVSEGKVRELWLSGKQVPKGWLFDKNWKSICDPTKFYENPRAAFLGPLGGKELGYKGFSLALMTEIFAGILTGGGFSQSTSANINNSGLFLTFHPALLGQTIEMFQEKVNSLIQYLKSSSESNNLHIPDGNNEDQISNIEKNRKIAVDTKLFKKLQLLMDQ